MTRFCRTAARFGVMLFALLCCSSMTAWAQSKPLGEEDIAALLKIGIDEETIVARIRKGGLSFTADDEAVERLKAAGASDGLVKALRESTAAKKPAPAKGGAPITYDDVLKLLKLGLDEPAILTRLEKSPTQFTLDAKQVQELKRAGASEKLIAAMQGKRGASADQTGDVTDFAVVLDCSGSMMEKTTDGKAKMDVAKAVVADLVEKIPDGLRLTFVLYGHNKKDGCNSVEIVRPLSELDGPGKEKLKSFIKTLKPAGATPIALALRVAGKELFRNDAYCGLVLISDGKESCKGDPAAEAAALALNDKLSFGVNVIGFDVKGDERESLEQIAASGKGKYYDADSAEKLEEAVAAVRKELESRTKAPEQRGNRELSLSGKKGQPGGFLHDAGPVEPGEYKGSLAMLEAHYYKIPLERGQELRVVGQIQKSPYNGSNNTNNQSFIITLYDPGLAVVARELITVKDAPKAVQTVRAAWTATTSGVHYIAISATDNHDGGFIPVSTYPNDAKIKPSPYALRIRVEGSGDRGRVASGDIPVPDVRGGNSFDEAGEIPIPGVAADDLKVNEVTFFKTPVRKGQTLTATAAVQKPWYLGSNHSIKANYTLTIYDDDQVEIAKKTISISKNPPDAHTLSVSWPVALDGHAYVSVSCENSGGSIYPKEFEPKPGHVAVMITETDAATGIE